MDLFLAAGVTESVENLIAAGGYVVLFSLLILCGLGLPLPEDIPLLVTGALIATGKMNPFIACTVAWAGIIGGDILLYNLGRKFGLEITRVKFIGRHLTKERIQRAEKFFFHYGIWVVAFGRMIAGVRAAMVVAAGATRFNFWKFVITDSLAAIVSGGLFVWLGYFLGANIERMKAAGQDIKYGIAILVVVILGIIGGWVLWRKRRLRLLNKLESRIQG